MRISLALLALLTLLACRGDKTTGASETGGSDDQETTDSGSGSSGEPCIDYTEVVADCAALVVHVDGGGSTWDGIDPDSSSLKTDLHNLINDHSGVSYDGLWGVFDETDARSDGSVWDMYSDLGKEQSEYIYAFEDDQCGQYSSEGDCYNREHSFPQSWSDDGAPERSDLHQVFPVDGYVNGIRGSLPLGPVGQVNRTTSNGSLRGESIHCGYDDDVFEPIDEYKGDLARALLYVSVRDQGADSDRGERDASDGAHLETWFEEVQLAWHLLDPVSDKETARNDAVEAVQGNRNPFVDRPELACEIDDF